MREGVTTTVLQVGFLIALQVCTATVLWLLNPLTQKATDTFALYLSIDLVAFATMSYLYRSGKNGRRPNQLLMSLGYLSLIVFLVSNLLLA